KALDDVLESFKAQKVDAQTLMRVKTKARAEVIRRLDNNAGLASLLTANYAAYGDWRKLFTSLDDLDKVTAEDVQRVAQKYFVTPSRTVAYTAAPRGAAQAGGAAEGGRQ
ncbi:MAG: insulinase family protein, partial [Acidobacteriia bacterium]|nr:insulinase family protein [Terriglobia bacterium]